MAGFIATQGEFQNMDIVCGFDFRKTGSWVTIIDP
jgi:hypothetical protein